MGAQEPPSHPVPVQLPRWLCVFRAWRLGSEPVESWPGRVISFSFCALPAPRSPRLSRAGAQWPFQSPWPEGRSRPKQAMGDAAVLREGLRKPSRGCGHVGLGLAWLQAGFVVPKDGLRSETWRLWGPQVSRGPRSVRQHLACAGTVWGPPRLLRKKAPVRAGSFPLELPPSCPGAGALGGWAQGQRPRWEEGRRGWAGIAALREVL